MKTTKYLIASLLLAAVVANANPVLVNTAQKVAQNFYAGVYPAGSLNMSLTYTERDANGQPIYYVFNVNTNKGFVIVTADDAAHPIIGYSNEGPFVAPTSNNNISFWLQRRKNEVIAIRAHNVAATSGIKEEWTTYSSNSNSKLLHIAHNISSTGVLPLCSTQWDQSPYYNGDCPGGSVTGCVATAMAQIMKYWAYPNIGMGSNCYDDETPYYSENYGQLCATFDTSHYVWSKMPLGLGGPNSQVAKLMYDCGVSVDMDYTPGGSAAEVFGGFPSAQYSYVTFFGYDNNTINEADYYDYTDSTWIALLENELNNKRPMQYVGYDVNEGGHTWVCDGYSAANDFHMNWGWGGSDDGYYSIDLLNPYPSDFTEDLSVLYGIQPPSALAVKQVTNNASTEVNVYPNPSTGLFNFTMPNGYYQVKIYNVLGQEVYTSDMNSGKGEINLASQPKGIYIYRLYTQEGQLTSTGRLVVE